MKQRVTLACLALALGGASLFPAREVVAQDIVALDTDAVQGAWLVPSDSPRTHAELVVLSGERDNGGTPGLAHYVEHLAWLSAVTPPGGSARGDAGGADSNATTGLTATRYWLDGPPEALDTMLATLARVLDPIELPEAFAREEVGIVRSEYELRFRDSPEAALALALARLQHGEQWPARSVIGTPDGIASFTPEAARALQRRTYTAANAVLLVEGRHERGAVAKAVAAAFPPATGEPLARPAYRMPPPATLLERRAEPRLGAPELLQSRLIELGEAPGLDALSARRLFLRDLLDSARPGGLAVPLRYDAFVAESFDLDFSMIDGRHAEMRFSARPDRGVTLEALQGAYENALASAAREGFPRDGFERARQHLLDELDSLERPALEVRDDAVGSITEGAVPLSLPGWRAAIAAVTLDDVNALLRAFADAPRTVTLLVTPGTDR